MKAITVINLRAGPHHSGGGEQRLTRAKHPVTSGGEKSAAIDLPLFGNRHRPGLLTRAAGGSTGQCRQVQRNVDMIASKSSASRLAYSPDGSPSPRVEKVMIIHRLTPAGTGTVYSTRSEA
jgi:hypothetical protein